MKIKINIGKSQLEIEGSTMPELFKKAAAFTQASNCGLCKSEKIAMNYKKVTAKEGKNAGKTFEFYQMMCMDCKAVMTFGQYNGENGSFFCKDWELYQHGEKSSHEKNSNSTQDEFFDNKPY